MQTSADPSETARLLLQSWANFYLATAGAAAALTGLVFVGVSISLARILEIPNISKRAVIALAFLMTILVASLLGLVPGQRLATLGWELLALALITELLTLRLGLALLHGVDAQYKYLQRRNLLADQLVLLPYLIAAVLLLFSSPAGLYVLVIAMLLTFLKALTDAWVLLIEIHR